ncbi:MAG: class I SAM-dependent methyltransferase [Magnetospirillum gryphiswaldense]|nr:class I SAM-dependent methyltransferase [Magnetospirillum gryphiswaldense]
MRLLLNRLVDKLCVRLSDILLDRMQARMLHPHALLLAEAQRDSADYARDHMARALVFKDRDDLLRLAATRAPAEGAVLEFGVAGGDSIRLLAAAMPGRPIHGFDSFEGLPEDWPGRHEAKGHYAQLALPTVPPQVSLHKGWFDATLPAYLSGHQETVALLHMDADLYSSTRTVLGLLAGRLRPGSIIVFDEYFNHVGWRDNEFRAFHEFVVEKRIGYRYLGWSYQQAAVVVESISP